MTLETLTTIVIGADEAPPNVRLFVASIAMATTLVPERSRDFRLGLTHRLISDHFRKAS